MTARDKKKLEPHLKLNMDFDEALARLIQTNPKEIADVFERTKDRSEEIRRSVEERRNRLRAAVASPKKRI